jgi:hypothetical protein
MSAIAALEAARAAGVRLKVEGGDLVLEACEEPPSSLLELVSLNKVGIVTMLRPGCDGWSADDWFAFFDERAGIAEFDGGLTRPEAEARAFECCIVEWLNRNAMHSPPGQCLGCGGCEYAHDPLLPYGIESFGQMWLHSRCWPRWHQAREAEAVAGLEIIGIACRSALKGRQILPQICCLEVCDPGAAKF